MLGAVSSYFALFSSTNYIKIYVFRWVGHIRGNLILYIKFRIILCVHGVYNSYTLLTWNMKGDPRIFYYMWHFPKIYTRYLGNTIFIQTWQWCWLVWWDPLCALNLTVDVCSRFLVTWLVDKVVYYVDKIDGKSYTYHNYRGLNVSPNSKGHVSNLCNVYNHNFFMYHYAQNENTIFIMKKMKNAWFLLAKMYLK